VLRRAGVLALVALLGASGCGGGRKRAPRSGDAGPSVVVVDTSASGLAVVPEKEPNEAATPQLVTLPGAVRGRIDLAGDVDVYGIEATAPATLALVLAAPADADLVLELQDDSGKKVLATSDNGPAGTTEGLPNYALDPGRYRVVVREFVKKGKKAPPAREAASQPYTLEASLGPAPAEGEEREPDDTAAFASEVPLPGAGRGFCGWRKDKDVWKVALTGVADDEALSVDVDGIAGVALRVAVLDGTEKVLLERQGRAGEALQLRNVAVREGEPHYYVVVSCPKGNALERYELRVASAPFELDEEAEPNDTVATAGPIADIPGAGGTRVGYLVQGDVDVFKLDPAAEPRALHVTVEPPPGMDAAVTVIDDKNQVVAGPAEAGGKGKPETLQNVPVPAGAVLYVKVTAKAGAPATERYRLRWSAAPAEAVVPVPGVDDE
jgi:hypothetical protein